MSIAIALTADAETGAGVDFNAGFAAFFADFAPYGMPFFLGPSEADTTQILHLDTPVAGSEADTRGVLLEGDDFLYTFANHTVSGTIDTIRLVRLGAAYDTETGELMTEEGVVTAATQVITLSGLGITNPAGVRGDVHEIVAGLMGGGPSGTEADAAPIWDHVLGQAHVVTGSAGDDRYAGTAFGDRVRGMAGADTLLGGGGRDWIDGGEGADLLTGGRGGDRFVFAAASAADGDRISDYMPGADRIDLARLDADVTTAGNQTFHFVGTDAFDGAAGALRVVFGATRATLVGDTDGDGVADFRIYLTGVTDLGGSDLVL